MTRHQATYGEHNATRTTLPPSCSRQDHVLVPHPRYTAANCSFATQSHRSSAIFAATVYLSILPLRAEV